jgi:hypothetical protein
MQYIIRLIDNRYSGRIEGSCVIFQQIKRYTVTFPSLVLVMQVLKEVKVCYILLLLHVASDMISV